MRQSFEKIIDGGDATGAITSGKIDARQVYAFSAGIISSDNTNAGTLKFQASNEPCPYGNVAAAFTPAAASWFDIPSASATIAAGATNKVAKTDACYAWIRAVWTPSAGAGTLTVQLNTQGF